MKHVRAIDADQKVTTHSLRHNMKHRLRVAGASKQVQDDILGHASGGVGETYGSAIAKLKVSWGVLCKA